MAKVDVKAVRQEIGRMFKRVKDRKARGREMKRIWAKHKKKAKNPVYHVTATYIEPNKRTKKRR